MLNHIQARVDRGCWAHALFCFYLGIGADTSVAFKRATWFPFFMRKKITKDKMEHVNENGDRCCKLKKLMLLKASSTKINAYFFRNGNGICALGLDSH